MGLFSFPGKSQQDADDDLDVPVKPRRSRRSPTPLVARYSCLFRISCFFIRASQMVLREAPSRQTHSIPHHSRHDPRFHLIRRERQDLEFFRFIRLGRNGVQVARLAGVPKNVVGEARRYLQELERREHATRPPSPQQDLSLALPENETESALRRMLEGVDPESLSPRAALDVLFRLKGLLDGKN